MQVFIMAYFDPLSHQSNKSFTNAFYLNIISYEYRCLTFMGFAFREVSILLINKKSRDYKRLLFLS